jgi:hypothetical protein
VGIRGAECDEPKGMRRQLSAAIYLCAAGKEINA